MMKKILAAAIVSAFAAPAFAATANVDIYGQMNVSVDSVDSSGSERRSRVSSNNTHLGFKGAEDLGGGLSAVWQFEYQVQLDQQVYTQPQPGNPLQGGVSLRNTFAGLSSKTLGALTFGTQESPLKTSTGPLAVYTNTLADYRSVFTRLSTRSDNSILYTSPDMGGFVAQAMYGARNEAGNGTVTDPRMYALSGVYKNGPLYATLAYEANKFVSLTTGVPYNDKAWRAGVGYTFGNTKLGLAYENNHKDAIALGATVVARATPLPLVVASPAVKANDGNAWYVSVAQKMGNITLNGAYTKRSDTLGPPTNDGATQMTFGADYNLSKRTMVYALYTQVDNERSATSVGNANIGDRTGIATVNPNGGSEASGFSLGMSHKF